ncbi:hypothetical protein HAX54_001272 [Datura stramonium]|uniref:Ribosome biogenesis protein NOP53 n=1 Tax=Datura stramonium TaxID=4076 RepID=A0ABS8T2Y7_DATST|nr:hypothetical protein [Datura stramonium]
MAKESVSPTCSWFQTRICICCVCLPVLGHKLELCVLAEFVYVFSNKVAVQEKYLQITCNKRKHKGGREMGKKTKSSRKGKKAWRANISTEDIEDFFDNSTKDALSGGSLAQAEIETPRKYFDVIACYSNAFVEPVPSSTGKKSKKKSKVQIAKDTAQQGQKDLAGGDSGVVDIWDDKGELSSKPKSIIDAVCCLKKPKTSVIPVVVEPRCSFNPPSESHQMYFLEADSGSDAKNENLMEDGNKDLEKRPQKHKMLTQVEKNRLARRKEQLKAEAKRERIRNRKRHLRRVTAKKEKLKSCPPRLGKRKFEPAPAQVLLSEEITGSLRKLKGCCTLARDRFKSLEKRGLVVPSKKSSRR